MLDANENYELWESEKFCKLIEKEIVYFIDNNGTYKTFLKDKSNCTSNCTMKDLINYFLEKKQIPEYEELKKENKILKKRIQELTKYKEFSDKFTSLEPKKRLKVTAEEIEKIKELRKQGVSIPKIAKTYGVTPTTIYNYLKK